MLIQLIKINIPQHLRVSIRIALAITSKFIGVLILLTDTEPSDELKVAARVSALIVLNFLL